MTNALIETYHMRPVSNLGVWDVGPLTFKAYGLLAQGKVMERAMIAQAKHFLKTSIVPRVLEAGDSNDLGFVIVHPGDTGLSISAHWWIQGSVLCQHIYRKEYQAHTPMDTTARPVIGCVWELEIVHAEHAAWRETMMGGTQNVSAYIQSRKALLLSGYSMNRSPGTVADSLGKDS